MKTLLIWDSFGETDLGMYVIDDPPDWLPKIHHQFLGGMGDDDVCALLERVNDALCKNPDHYGNPDDELAGAWVSMKVDLGEVYLLDLGGPVQVVVSGCVP
jgi:hypothetical protein